MRNSLENIQTGMKSKIKLIKKGDRMRNMSNGTKSEMEIEQKTIKTSAITTTAAIFHRCSYSVNEENKVKRKNIN